MTTSTPSSEGQGAMSQGVRGRRAGLTARYLVAVGREAAEEGLTPAALATAAVQVLPVDGAGVSMMVRELRMPLGASSDDVARAEELQTTLGEGPCLHAAQTRSAVSSDLDDLAARWPLYAEQLTGRRPFRAVVAVPLRAPGGSVFAALDLYTTSPQLDAGLDLADVDQHVAAPAAALLSTCVDEIHDLEQLHATPEWYQTAAGRRHNAWVAIGMVMANRNVRRPDVVSLLRAQAYAEDRSLDDVAADIVEGRLPPDGLAT